METKTEKFIYFLIAVIIALPQIFLNIWVVWKICELWQLTFLTSLPYTVFFGYYLVVNIMLYRSADKDEKLFELIAKSIGKTIGLFLVWGSSYILLWILK